MATVEQNKQRWTTYDWAHQGDEWSEIWGGTTNLWNGTIHPRIRNFIPSGHILEIAPGYGRCTQYLLRKAQTLSIVDLSENCIHACQKRFRDYSNINYYVNDGKSLTMVPDNSIDFVFSWDSLVHVESEIIQSYLQHISKKLKPGGAGFLHHSNIGAHKDTSTGKLTVENKHWRGESMSAELFRTFCANEGLACVAQEIIGWGGIVLNDCFSLITKAPAKKDCVIISNPTFMDEALNLKRISELYRI